MAYLSFLSLEQDFSLKLKSDTINKTDNPIALQNQLIDLFIITLKLDQEIHELLFKNKTNQVRQQNEFDDKLSAYKTLIRTKLGIEELRDTLIEAHRKYVAKKNFAEIVKQDNLSKQSDLLKERLSNSLL